MILRERNVRVFMAGQLVAYTLVWLVRITQDWYVLNATGSAAAVGLTSALQLVPTVLLGPLAGLLVDRYSNKTLLLGTQGASGLIAAGLWIIAAHHGPAIWHVYVLAATSGIVAAVDSITRQVFVTKLGDRSATAVLIGLNSSLFSVGGLIGPAVGGAVIAAIGADHTFLLGSCCYLIPLASLFAIHLSESAPEANRSTDRYRDIGQLFASDRSMAAVTLLVGITGFFTINLPVTLASYARGVFHFGSSGYGMLMALVAVGSVAGALLAPQLPGNGVETPFAGVALLSVSALLASAVPTVVGFSCLMPLIGVTMLTFLTSSNAFVQLAAPPHLHGRVVAVYISFFIGMGALGGPTIGWLDQATSPRMGMLAAGVIPAIAGIGGALWIRASATAGRRTPTGS